MREPAEALLCLFANLGDNGQIQASADHGGDVLEGDALSGAAVTESARLSLFEHQTVEGGPSEVLRRWSMNSAVPRQRSRRHGATITSATTAGVPSTPVTTRSGTRLEYSAFAGDAGGFSQGAEVREGKGLGDGLCPKLLSAQYGHC